MRTIFLSLMIAGSLFAQSVNGVPNQTITSTGHQAAGPFGCADTSASATTYTCATTSSFTPSSGDLVQFTGINQPNSGSSTLNVNGAGAKTIKKLNGSTNLANGDLTTGGSTWMLYDGTNWQMQGQIANASAGAAGGGPMVYSAPSITLTGTTYFPVGGGGLPNTTEASAQSAAVSTVTISNFSASLSAAPGGGNSVAFTWRKCTPSGGACTGSDQSVTCTISGTSALTCTDVAHSFSVTAGDLIVIKAVTIGTIVGTPMVTLQSQAGTTNNNGTVNSGTAKQLTMYGASGTTVSGTTNLTWDDVNKFLSLTNGSAPSAPSSGSVSVWTDSADLRFHDKNSAGTIGTTVVANAGAANQFFNGLSAAGLMTGAQPAFTNILGIATPAQLSTTVNAQTGTSYPIVDSDRFKIISQVNSAAVAYTIAQAGTAGSFAAGWCTKIFNFGVGLVTITPTTSTITSVFGSGLASVAFGQGTGELCSDGTNYLWTGPSPRILTSTYGPGSITVGSGATIYLHGIGSATATTNVETNRQSIVPTAGTLSNFYCWTVGTQPGTNSLVVTLRKNLADTAITFTIAASQAGGVVSDTTHTATVAAGDLLSIKLANGSGNTSTAFASCSYFLQ